MIHNQLRSTELMFVALTGLLASNTLLAQAPAETGGSFALEEIIVTATKRPETLQEVPQSISVVSMADLQTQNISDTSALTRLVPSVSFNQSFLGAANVFSVRGVGTNAGGVGVEQSVGVAFDGVPVASAVGSVADLVDVQHVEVLKGPQGMLFGKNASAGLINIVSVLPQIGQSQAIGHVSFGTLNDRQYTATFNIPISDVAALRISGWKFAHDGTVHEVLSDQDMNDRDATGSRIKFRFKPSENLDVNLTGEFSSHDQNGAAYTIRTYQPDQFTAINSGAQIYNYDINTVGQQPGPNNRLAYDINDRSVNPKGYYDKGDAKAYTLQTDYTTANQGAISSVFSYRESGVDQSTAPYPSSNPYSNQPANIDVGNFRQFSGEVRYASPAMDRFHYVVGLFYFHSSLRDQFELAASGTLAFPPNFVPFTYLSDYHAVQTQANKSYAGFGEATFNVTDKLSLIAGVRQTRDEVSGAIVRTMSPTVFDLFGVIDTSTSAKDDATSWRGGIQYKFNRDVMAYATASRGNKGPGIMYNVATAQTDIDLAGKNGIVTPETVMAYEVGLKSVWFDRLTANIAVFDETFNNFQTTLTLPGRAVSPIASNAPQLKSTGAELDLGWVVTSQLSLSTNVAYTDARFTDFKKGRCYTNQTVAQGCYDQVNQYQDLSGKPLFNSSKWNINAAIRYDAPVSSKLNAFAELNDAYVSKKQFEALNNPNEVQPAYSLVNLSAGVHANDSQWRVTLSVNNVFDKHYVDAMLQQQGVFVGQIIGYNAQRNYHAALDVRF